MIYIYKIYIKLIYNIYTFYIETCFKFTSQSVGAREKKSRLMHLYSEAFHSSKVFEGALVNINWTNKPIKSDH